MEIQFQKRKTNTFAYVSLCVIDGQAVFKVTQTDYNPETEENENESVTFLGPKGFAEMMATGQWVVS